MLYYGEMVTSGFCAHCAKLMLGKEITEVASDMHEQMIHLGLPHQNAGPEKGISRFSPSSQMDPNARLLDTF